MNPSESFLIPATFAGALASTIAATLALADGDAIATLGLVVLASTCGAMFARSANYAPEFAEAHTFES